MGYFLTSGGTVLELDVPTEGTHARERFEEQLAKQELVPVLDDQVSTVQSQYGADKDGKPLYATQFVLVEGYHAPPPPGDTAPETSSDATEPGSEDTSSGDGDDGSQGDELVVPDGTVDDVLGWVHGGPEPEGDPADGWEDRAAAALEAEHAKGDKARSTLVERLTSILGG